jgi:hypothetical protein
MGGVFDLSYSISLFLRCEVSISSFDGHDLNGISEEFTNIF